jgi:hypothetical protein
MFIFSSFMLAVTFIGGRNQRKPLVCILYTEKTNTFQLQIILIDLKQNTFLTLYTYL